MWAQTWDNINDIVVPYPKEDQINITALLKKKKFNTMKMFKVSTNFAYIFVVSLVEILIN